MERKLYSEFTCNCFFFLAKRLFLLIFSRKEVISTMFSATRACVSITLKKYRVFHKLVFFFFFDHEVLDLDWTKIDVQGTRSNFSSGKKIPLSY